MAWTRRARKALQAIRQGRTVDMSGWTVDEARAVLEAAIRERAALALRCRRVIGDLERELAKLRRQQAALDEDMARLREALKKVNEHAGQGEDSRPEAAAAEPGPGGG